MNENGSVPLYIEVIWEPFLVLMIQFNFDWATCACEVVEMLCVLKILF